MAAKGLRFAHLGDVHLGHRFAYLPREKRRVRQREVRETFTRMLEEISRQGVELVLVAGDLFEHEAADKALVQTLQDRLGKVGVPVVVAAGNHDPLVSDSPYLAEGWPANVHVLRGPGWQVVDLPELDATVVGLSHQAPDDPGHGLEGVPETSRAHRIVVAHATLDDLYSSSPCLPATVQDLERLRADYLALGHYHNFHPIHDSEGRLCGCYPGTPEPVGFDERGQHGFVVGRLHDGDVHLDFVPLAQRSYLQAEVNVSGCESLQDILERAEAAMRVDDGQHLWELVLTGEVDTDLNVDTDWLAHELQDRAFFVKVRSDLVPAYNLFEMKKRPGVVSYFIAHMENKLSAAQSAAERQKIQRAIVVGLDALTKGELKRR